MPPFVSKYLEKAQGFWADSSMSQRLIIGGLTAAVIISFALMIFWMNRPDYKVLMTNLYPEDASRVVAMLQAAKEDYVLEDNGKTVKVPADRVYELRLKVAGEGSLHGQGIGFEIFDEVQIGQTDFVQHVNYQRALQGELAHTISEFPIVERPGSTWSSHRNRCSSRTRPRPAPPSSCSSRTAASWNRKRSTASSTWCPWQWKGSSPRPSPSRT